MKANYIGNKSDYNKLAMQVAREEVERQKADVCPACEKNIGDQVLAVTLKALHDEFGFGKQRLQKIVCDVENLFSLCAVDGKRFNAVQAVEWLKDSMGIDLGSDSK
jgi:hypothetical protein